MGTVAFLDMEAIRAACEKHGVLRLRVFGSALTDRFDEQASDVDFLVTFLPGRENLFHDFFDLKVELGEILGRKVDLVSERAIKNPFFRASALESAQDLYAA